MSYYLPPRPTHRWIFTAIIFVVLISLAFGAPPVTSQYRADLIKWEGYRSQVYSRGIREPYLVGIGHKLTDAERRANGFKSTYSHAQINQFFYFDLNRSVEACRRAFRLFDKHPASVQIALVNIAFTCGPTGLLQWVRLRAAIDRKDYVAASKEIRNSRWAYQVQPARVRAMEQYLLSAK